MTSRHWLLLLASSLMPPPFLHLTSLFLFFSISCSSHPCFPQSSFDCPPFSSFLSFPFGASPGCGHPSFQIHCSSNHSTISINNSSFPINSQRSNSLNISLLSSTPHHCPLPLNLSNSPFRISNSTCSELSRLPNSCTNLTFSHCNLSDSNIPLEPFKGCRNAHPKQIGTICSIAEFLKSKIQLEWDLKGRDTYFSSCDKCLKQKRGFCGYNNSEPKKGFLCYESDSGDGQIALFSALFAIACLTLVSAGAVTIFRCRGWRSKGGEEDPTAVFLHQHRSSHLLPPVFTYEELDSVTNRFDQKRKIGDGGFGSVYLAQLADGQIVAIKRLHKRHAAATASKSFCNEVLILSSISHPNLVRLHGYCSDPRGLILVYDYVPNGTLADHLHGSKSLYRRASLTWPVRVNVALQTAMAIEYLHFSVAPAVVHRDITSSNIFVERDMRVKLGDFGLSRLLVVTEPSATYVWTGPQGTPGYLDPDYHRSFRLTEKSDVYSFGVVLFELISGMKAVDLRREKREVALADLVVGKIQVGELRQVVDPVLVEGEEAVGTVDAVAELAFRCVAMDKDDRPDAREVVAELRRIRSRLRGQKPSNSAAGDACKS